MNLRILFTFIFLCVQLFAYTALCADNAQYYHSAKISHKDFVLNNFQNGMLNKSQNDSHFVCQNISTKSVSSQRESNNQYVSNYALEFKYSQFQALIKYIYDNSFLKINCTKLAYSTEVNRRAP